jgi:hypothetical protein
MMRPLIALLWIVIPLCTANAQQLLVMHREWANDANDQSSDCVQVETDGSYRFEHTPFFRGQQGPHEIHAGKLGEDEMKQLAVILDDPALESLATPSPGSGSMRGGAPFDYLLVVIDRSGQTQKLYFNSSGHNLSTGKHHPSIYQAPAIKPLWNWYKDVGKRKNNVDKTLAPLCSRDSKTR